MNNSIVPYSGDNRQPQSFDFEGNNVRILINEHGEEEWVVADVCKAIKINNVGNALARIPENEKGVRSVDTLGGPQQMSIVREPGLYRLIFRSDKPEAERFQTLVFNKILPSIRKYGFYSAVPMTQTQALLVSVQRMVDIEAEQARQADMIQRIEARQGAQDQERYYWTIYEYAQYVGKHVDPGAAVSLGKKAASHCRTFSIKVGKRKVAGRTVGTYPEDVLKQIFDNWYLQFSLLEEE